MMRGLKEQIPCEVICGRRGPEKKQEGIAVHRLSQWGSGMCPQSPRRHLFFWGGGSLVARIQGRVGESSANEKDSDVLFGSCQSGTDTHRITEIL